MERERGLLSRGSHRLVFSSRVVATVQLYDPQTLTDLLVAYVSHVDQTKRLRSDGRLASQTSRTETPVEVRGSLWIWIIVLRWIFYVKNYNIELNKA